jgi:hypothetical protein
MGIASAGPGLSSDYTNEFGGFRFDPVKTLIAGVLAVRY